MPISFRRVAALTALLALLAACGTTPPIRHYSLGPMAAGPAAPQAAADTGIVVGPVSLPAGIDRLQIVRTVEGTRVDIADSHRWSGSLKDEVARRLAGGIARQTGIGRVVAWPQSTLAAPALTVPIDIQRFDAEGFERVTLEAVWAVRKAGRDIAGRRFVASETVASPDYAALTAAHGRLVDALARDISDALGTAQANQR
ncbi:MAG: membrane integrity-associated transporter subunit PqiC [Methyloversatilis sp.]|jgi:uncharacterized lipoprotein YmbA|nr:membrane integrity-associated transporter subunit PqiC [Methyloversatilis sp.]MBP6193506.1 membrane integrity-associated transporter subunit PqiC [Methyloversatilis sp.]MBP9117087.1 membrane integrity-associated transporter subunit PqiC [Methyloversatilis sp.]